MIQSIKSFFCKGSQYKLFAFVSLFLLVFLNGEFYAQVLTVYCFDLKNLGFLSSLIAVLYLLTFLVFNLIAYRFSIKYILVFVLIVSSIGSYFMSTYHIIIDAEMIQNILDTNLHEAFDLFSYKQVVYLFAFAIVPSFYVYHYEITKINTKKNILLRSALILLSISLIIINYFAFSKYYTSFFREHKSLRFYLNPVYWQYSLGKYIGMQFENSNQKLLIISKDAKIFETKKEPKELVILVVGETARADRFWLNGYARETNPLLKKEELLNFENMSSCGTSTAVSVPCMFSMYDRNEYSYNKASSTQNLLDVLTATTKVQVLWRDNNSDSKGVALRVEFEDYKSLKNNTICDEECRDEGMLIGLDGYINKHKDKDILIILHQMGNHGPAYYKRYPKSFEKFTPVCKTNQLEECSKQEINNAYDNAIVYTDYFLSKTIGFLKKYDDSHEVAMVYMSDHGESLGESGVYLHGLPYFIAPKEQMHVASFMWFGSLMKEELNMETLSLKSKKIYTQDNLFHTLLGMFEVQSQVYDKQQDILNVQ